MAVRTPLVLGIDAGGTMTDTFIVDEAGGFEVGKAPTTPEDESVGFLESTEDAIHYWGMELEELFPKLEVTLYSGTTILNTLLTRRGQRVGLLVTNGFEDMLLMNRGLIWAGYSYADTLHAVTHVHPKPLAPVAVAADTLAMLSVPEVASRLDAFDLLAVQEAATVVALVLMRERIALETERRLRGDLLTEIVTGAIDDEETFLHRATLLGHDLLAPHALVLVDVAPPMPGSGSGKASQPAQSVALDLYELVRELVWRDTPQWLIASRESRVAGAPSSRQRGSRREDPGHSPPSACQSRSQVDQCTRPRSAEPRLSWRSRDRKLLLRSSALPGASPRSRQP